MSEMSDMIQESTANAEESAAASEEMNSQAEQLRTYVKDLLQVISGNSSIEQNQLSKQPHSKANTGASNLPAIRGKISRKARTTGEKVEVIPDKTLSPTEGDFDDF